MYKHFIAIISSYVNGSRYAWHYSEEEFDITKIQTFINLFEKTHGDIPLGTHMIVTEEDSWESVVEKDQFFADVIPFTKSLDFIRFAVDNQKLTALDIAKYIISKESVTNLKLQKLVYLSYERFLLQTKQKLFDDKIEAWTYGPVIKSVYDTYKDNGRDPISILAEDDSVTLKIEGDLDVPLFLMRLISSNHGLEAMKAIEETLAEFSHYTASQLVEYTHMPNQPWSQVNINEEITDAIILKCHSS